MFQFLLLELVNFNYYVLYKEDIQMVILIIIHMVLFLIKFLVFIILQPNNLDLKLLILIQQLIYIIH